MPARIRHVEVIERLHCLKTFPLFSGIPADELTALAEAAREVFSAKRTAIVKAGAPVREVHFVVEGKVRVREPDDGGEVLVGPGSGVGLLELLARVDRGPEAFAATDVLTLALDRESILDALEDEFGIWKHLLGAMAVPLIEEASRGAFDLLPRPEDDAPESARTGDRELDFAEVLLFLRHSLPFAERHLVMLAELSRSAREVRFRSGEVVWQVGAAADAFVVVLSGELSCAAGANTPFVAGHHRPAGLLEALSGGPRWYTATAASPTRGLSIPGRALLDAFEDNSELAMAFMGSLAKLLLASGGVRAAAAAAEPAVSAAS